MKVLLLTDVPPNSRFSGSLLTEQLCSFLPQGSVACFTVLDPVLGILSPSPKLDWLPIEFARKPRERALRIPAGKLGSLSAFLLESFNAHIKTRAIIKKAVRFGKLHGVDRIWCILQGQTMIRMALPVARQLDKPLFTQVWDHPSWWIMANGIDRISGSSILKTFDNVIANSTAFGAASFSMAEQYHKKFGIASVPLIAGLDSTYGRPAKSLSSSGKLLIGLAGQVYAAAEWEALLASLESSDWMLGGREVTIRYLGYSPTMGHGHRKLRLELLGYRSQYETVSLLSECDILYCPYPLSPEFEIVSRTSFPSKLTTYLAAGRPVFFHGPDYASPAEFLRQHGAGVLCHTLHPSEILASLSQLVSEPKLYEACCKNGSKAFRDCLSTDSLKAYFLRFLQAESLAQTDNEADPS
jgi:hypothetical protein